jgi:hypothetical protein
MATFGSLDPGTWCARASVEPAATPRLSDGRGGFWRESGRAQWHALPRTLGNGGLVRLTRVAMAGAASACIAVLAPATVAPATADAGPGFTVSNTSATGAPVRWNPCVPVTWKMNPGRGGAREVARLRRAMKKAARESGLTLFYRGTTTWTPSSLDAVSPDGVAMTIVVTPAASRLAAGGMTTKLRSSTPVGRATRYTGALSVISDRYVTQTSTRVRARMACSPWRALLERTSSTIPGTRERRTAPSTEPACGRSAAIRRIAQGRTGRGISRDRHRHRHRHHPRPSRTCPLS